MNPKTLDLFKEFVAKTLYFKRKAAGFSQTDLARIVDVMTYTVSDWESGRCRIPADRLYELSLIFQCPITDFFPAPVSERVKAKRARA